jgi:hypothetical protein
MNVVGFTMLLFLGLGGMAAGQYVFYLKTGRTFWRALIPHEIREKLFPEDGVRLDPFMHLEEWFALLFLGSMLCLPLIGLHFIGFLKIFE